MKQALEHFNEGTDAFFYAHTQELIYNFLTP